MKHTKKIISLILAMLMIVSLAVSVSAESIEITNDEGLRTGHTYKVYQIFTAKLDGEVLTEVKYGKNYIPDGKNEGDLVPTEELKELAGTEEALAKAFAKKLIDGNLLKKPAIATLSEKDGWETEDLAYGYYLIVDETNPLPEYHSYSAYMVKLVEDVDMAPKADVIDDDKKIESDDYDDNYADADDGDEPDDSVFDTGKASNGAVGSEVRFELTVNVPENADKYSYYYCILSDNLSEGLTFNENSVVVKVGDDVLVEGTDYYLYTTLANFYIPEGAAADQKAHYENADFQVAMANAADLAGKKIVLTYSATINENAIIGVEGNPNDFNTIYSNDPNYDYDDETKNGKPDEDEDAPIGETPVKRTITYLTGLKLKKVDENGNTLKGAKFKLEGESVKHVLIEEEVFTQDENGKYYKLTDGKYTEEAPREKDQYVEKTAEEGRDGGYVKVGDNAFEPASDEQLKDTSIQLYKLLKANKDSYEIDGEGNFTKYVKSIVLKEEIASETEDVEVEVGADGIIYFSGLGEGEYTITETVTPAGYNTIEPITVTIDWELPDDWVSIDPNNDNCEWTVSASNGTGALTMNNDGVFELEVVNVKGVELPETGGIGTTIFYIVGGLLAAAAIVLLVAKKRMSSAE